MGVKVEGDDKFAAGENGSYTPPKKEKTLSYGQGKFMTENAGVEYGLSERESMDPNDSEPPIDYAVDGMTGNATERRDRGSNDVVSVSGKGKNFDLGTF